MRVRVEPYELRNPSDPNRSVGLHLSTILRDLALMTGVLNSKYSSQEGIEGSATVAVGFAFEEWAARNLHPEMVFHPEELHLDGISMSPDGLTLSDLDDVTDDMAVEPGTWILNELKTTRKSSRGFLETLQSGGNKAKLWLWQIMAYRHALNQLYPEQSCLVAKLHVLFLAGDYSYSGTPESETHYRIFRLEFTPEELAKNWRMILAHKQALEEEGRINEQGEITPF